MTHREIIDKVADEISRKREVVSTFRERDEPTPDNLIDELRTELSYLEFVRQQ